MKRIFHLSRGGTSGARDVQKEIETHLALLTKEFEARGMTPADARRAAIDTFGDPAAVQSEVTELHDATVRTTRRRAWLADLGADATLGLRSLRRSPGFALVALLTLAIGIGANTAIFSVLRSVLLRPLPYAQPEQLVQVWSDHRALGRKEPEWLTPPDFADWRDQNRTFTSMAAYQGWLPDLTGDGDPESLTGALVSGNYFDLLGVQPAVGRLLTPADDDPNAAPVVVLSHALWTRRFGGDSGIVGKNIQLNGVSYAVSGVLPADFRPPLPGQADVIRATRRPATSGCGRGCIVLRVIGRMKPGVTVAQAQDDLAHVAARIAQQFPETNAKVGAWLVPLHEQITGKSKSALLALTGAVALVLLIGCVNLANLLLVRGAARSRELGVRAALGAGRARIVRQLVTENAVLALLGGTLGVVLGVLGSRALGSLVPDAIRRVQVIHVDGGVLAFSAAITLLAGAIFGIAPALRPVRNTIDALRSGARETGRGARTVRRALAVSQLSLAVVLLVGAGLLLRSFLLMERVDVGFRTEGALFTSVAFPASRYDNAHVVAAQRDLLDRLRANAAFRAVEATDLPPLTPGGDQDITAIPVGEPTFDGAPRSIWYRSVTAGYLGAMHMRLVSGRMFSSADGATAARVGIVNEEAAKKFWPGKD
ncbi:MAG TPA: ABC transporter permease, partial [Gemmatimonadaceae bacterium]|nr:ABC transporter permease [Gemmatimonadaceae bacterium]